MRPDMYTAVKTAFAVVILKFRKIIVQIIFFKIGNIHGTESGSIKQIGIFSGTEDFRMSGGMFPTFNLPADTADLHIRMRYQMI